MSPPRVCNLILSLSACSRMQTRRTWRSFHLSRILMRSATMRFASGGSEGGVLDGKEETHPGHRMPDQFACGRRPCWFLSGGCVERSGRGGLGCRL